MDNTNNGVSVISNSCYNALQSIISSTETGNSKLLLIIYNSSKSKSNFTRLSCIKCFNLVITSWVNFEHEKHFQKYSIYLVSALNDSSQLCRNEGIECYKSMLKLFPNKMKTIYNQCNRMIQKKIDVFDKPLPKESKLIESKPKLIIKKKTLTNRNQNKVIKKSVIKESKINSDIEKEKGKEKEEINKNETNSNQKSSFSIGKKVFTNLKALGKAKRINISKSNELFKRKILNENENKSKRICLSDITNK